jgi:3-phosphoshikimate 1-carboxyvinyltransferase
MTPKTSNARSRHGPALAGTLTAPGDKSISHRALILNAIATGTAEISGLLEGVDVLDTAKAMSALGAQVKRTGPGQWTVTGVGEGGLTEPTGVLDFGNSGTGSRLIMGVIATAGITATLTGDASLTGRPMGRVLDPLALFGARALSRKGGRMPLTLAGVAGAQAIAYETPMPSAQVKSAVLLAGLNAHGQTVVIEAKPTRDHTETLLKGFGADILVEATQTGGRRITLNGTARLSAQDMTIPGDPSSAAFAAVAALIVPGSRIRIENVLMNPTRAGLYQTLIEMGADIRFENRRETGGEAVADLVVTASALKGITVPADRAPAMIDEYPILAVAAAFATGETRMEGLEELRVKESDRLAATAALIAACGGTSRIEGDDLIVTANGSGTGRLKGGAIIDPHHDHRLAMAALVLGLASEEPVTVTDIGPIATSYPAFFAHMASLGADIVASEAGETA